MLILIRCERKTLFYDCLILAEANRAIIFAVLADCLILAEANRAGWEAVAGLLPRRKVQCCSARGLGGCCWLAASSSSAAGCTGSLALGTGPVASSVEPGAHHNGTMAGSNRILRTSERYTPVISMPAPAPAL
jgi:hypothetical protein